jgi:hypothetical protein
MRHIKQNILLLFFLIVSAATIATAAQPVQNSKLSSGKTLKIATDVSGVYRVNYSDIVSKELATAPFPSNKLALYGNKAGVLSRINDSTLYDDLRALPIEVFDGGDGVFGQGDYFLFYGQSPVLWQYTGDTNRPFTHIFNPYNDYTCYFISINENSTPVRIENLSSSTKTPQENVSSFTDYLLHENEIKNLCSSGLNWFGELFSANGANMSFSFTLTDINLSESVICAIQTAIEGYNGSNSASFSLSVGDLEYPVTKESEISNDCAGMLSATIKTLLTSPNMRLRLTYNKTIAAGGYLDFIEIQYKRNLVFPRNGELLFRNYTQNIAQYNISQANSNIRVWDVTNPLSVKNYTTKLNGNTLSFISENKNLSEFIAFDINSAHTPIFLGIADTQNLHAYTNPDLLIVSHPNFIQQAEKIAEIHRKRDNIGVAVMDVNKVYNEFSSGSKDPSAIRLAAKMFYDRYKADSINNKRLRYLLLMGNGSIDPKGKSGTITDFIPTFETYRSTDKMGSSYSSPMEDAFAYLDEGEGNTDINNRPPFRLQEIGTMDIAVGRIPAKTTAEAINALEKIDIYTNPQYLQNTENPFAMGNLGNWRNTVTFIADDNDGFVESYESLNSQNFGFGPSLYINFPNINFEKIYSDAYRKVSTAVASTYPEAHQAILDRINSGGLFMGYMGHSGWNSCADEGLMSINDIESSWGTTYGFPIMFFSSCSAAPFDKIELNSIGEQAVLFPHGGAIAVIASPRENFKNYIERIQADFVASLVTQNETGNKTIGDAFLYAKQRAKNTSGFRFVLLGDPALRIPLPKYDVVTTHINGLTIDEELDTLSAFSTITVDGVISNNGNILTDFNGILQVSVFDKIKTEQTLANPHSKGGEPNPLLDYLVQKNILYQGSAEVKNGLFSFTFIVPKDIAYNYGYGKISYYAYSDSSGDASGYFNKIIVGGFNNEVTPDTLAPTVRLYIDHNGFIDGSTVGKLPNLYAEISDRYGINTTGSGIGHDMELIIDDDQRNPIIVNRLFQYKTGSYTEGNLSYPLHLSAGKHKAKLRVWNIFNVSATAEIEFEISNKEKFQMFDFYTIPNPVSISRNNVSFYFSHNAEEKLAYCEIAIFDILGSRVTSFKYDLSNNYGYVVEPLSWNVKNMANSQLRKGLYICRVRVVTASGFEAKTSDKIILVE